MVISFVLAGLTLSSTISIRWLIIVSVFQGIVNAFDMPGRQAFVVTLIEDKRDLGNAIALNSSMFNAARLVGPSIAGVIIALSNEGWCYFIDGTDLLIIEVLMAIGLLLNRLAGSSSAWRRRSCWPRLEAAEVMYWSRAWSRATSPARPCVRLLKASSTAAHTRSDC